MNPTTFYMLAVIFVATTIRSALGFGEALIAVPLLVFCMPLSVAAPLAVLVSITIAGLVVFQDWRNIHWNSAAWLVFGTLFGIPLGLMVLVSSYQRALKIALALFIVGFAAYSFINSKLPELKSDSKKWLLCCGFFAGVFGGAYGMNGPPLAIYGSMRRWPPQQFRATLQGYFFPASILGMAGYWWQGLWGPAVTHNYLMALPITIVATWLGRKVNRRLHAETFLKYIYCCLVLIGLGLLVEALST
jgi:hypothetical protein